LGRVDDLPRIVAREVIDEVAIALADQVALFPDRIGRGGAGRAGDYDARAV
jgi:hypothetical protein